MYIIRYLVRCKGQVKCELWNDASKLSQMSAATSMSSSSTKGRGGHSVRSLHGPNLGTVHVISNGQAIVWTNLVQPGNGRTAPQSALVWEQWNSILDVACHVQNCFGRYIIHHMCNSEIQRRQTIDWILCRPDLVLLVHY